MLIDRAARLHETRPPRETLDFLDSIQGTLDHATEQQREQFRLIRIRSRLKMSDDHEAMMLLDNILGGEMAPGQRLRVLDLIDSLIESRERENRLVHGQAGVSGRQDPASRHQRLFQQYAALMAGLILVMMLILLVRTLRDRHYFRHLSAHDGLTGMLNHTHFFETAKQRVQDAGRRGQRVTLLLADIDHFKQFNDRHGHQAGDEVLRQAARCFVEILSPHGVVGRIGGEEFAACLPGTETDTVAERVRQLRHALRTCQLSEVDRALTMSFGVARSRPHEEFDRLRARADAAMYRAKRQGRDRVVMAESLAG